MIENNVFIKGRIGMFLFLQNADGQTCVEHVALFGNMMGQGFGNMMGQGMVGLIGLVLVGLLVVALWRIMDAANAAAPEHRTMEPGMIWLLLIPVFQVYWNFRALPEVSKSLAATMRDKGLNPDDCGQGIGVVWSLLVVAIYILHIIGWTISGALFSIGAAGVAEAAMFLLGLLVLLGWLAVCVCIVMYIVKVQAAKAKILAAGDVSSPPA